MKYFPVFNYNTMVYLLFQGFAVVDIQPHDKQPNRQVYYFIDSSQLREAIERRKYGN